MILAVDVDYREERGHAAGLTFQQWQDPRPESVFKMVVDRVSPYEPGSFYKRELPCILSLLRKFQLRPECIVIDGFVFLGEDDRPGLFQHLYDRLIGEVTIIGVAKKPFNNTPQASELYRGKSKHPLYVTSQGMDLERAKDHISSMHGQFRIPTLLKEVDRLARDWGEEA